MTEIIKADAAAEFDAFVASHPKGHFMQQSAWSKVKNNWIWRGIICRNDNGEIVGTMAVIIRRLPGGIPFSMLYSPRGPVCDLHDKAVFTQLMDAAKSLAKEFNGYVLQIDTDTKIDDTEYEKIAVDYGFKVGPRSKNFEGIQPRFVIRMDVEGKTEDEVFASFHSRHRYKVRVAKKNNVEVVIKGAEAAEEFHKIMVETGERDNFSIRPADYFKRMVEAYGDNARIYMAYSEGKAIAGTLAIHCGDKVWYLYGASSNEERNKMPNYLLQWEMIRWSVENGCRIYDFRGISGDLDENNPLYGLYRFKKGFCPEITEFIGDFYYVYKPLIYNGMELAQKLRKKLRKGH